jgi:hypothetical protein
MHSILPSSPEVRLKLLARARYCAHAPMRRAVTRTALWGRLPPLPLRRSQRPWPSRCGRGRCPCLTCALRPHQAVRAHPSRPIVWRMNARSYWYDSETPGALCTRRGVHADLPYPKLKHKLPTFWIHTVRFGSKMYVLEIWIQLGLPFRLWRPPAQARNTSGQVWTLRACQSPRRRCCQPR